jgi:hypothetical protein
VVQEHQGSAATQEFLVGRDTQEFLATQEVEYLDTQVILESVAGLEVVVTQVIVESADTPE